MASLSFDSSLERVPPGTYITILPQDHAPPPSPPLPPGFDERLARENLASINPGPDGLESLQACQCNTAIYEIIRNKSASTITQQKNQTKKKEEASHSPLLKLPRELREAIYAYAVTYPDPIPIRLSTVLQNGNTAITRRSAFFTPPLQSVCKQTEEDATLIFHALNTFRGTITDGDISVLTKWLRRTPKSSLCHVRDLQIVLAPNNVFDVQALRKRLEGEGTRELAQAIVKTGMDLGAVVMVLPKVGERLERDAAMVDSLGAVGWEVLREEWFGELRSWMDFLGDEEAETVGLVERLEGLVAADGNPQGEGEGGEGRVEGDGDGGMCDEDAAS